MKDYYRILGVPEDCSDEDIKKAFRKLAFEHHPDTNPGREKEAEARFKEINEAYGVLGDKTKRRQYDAARKGGFSGAGSGYRPGGFQYSQQDIFNGMFANRAMYEELNRMFSQGGLRFDQDFLNRVFSSGGANGIRFQFFTGPGGVYGNSAQPNAPARKPGWLERQMGRIVNGLFRFVFKRLFQLPEEAGQSLDHHADLELSPEEADAGGEKQINHVRDGQIKKLLVKIPKGVKTDTKIRLKGMGRSAGGRAGDLYLHVKIKGQIS